MMTPEELVWASKTSIEALNSLHDKLQQLNTFPAEKKHILGKQL